MPPVVSLATMFALDSVTHKLPYRAGDKILQITGEDRVLGDDAAGGHWPPYPPPYPTRAPP